MLTKKDLQKIAESSRKEKEEKKKLTEEERIALARAIDNKKHRIKEKSKEEIIEEIKVEEVIPKPIASEDGWDVPKDLEVTFFDPELSYEITGYRPITETRGLDFDPKVFTVAADTYRQSGRYTLLLPGTFKHLLHWKEEFDRCANGVTIGKYTLTGENYFFLNYYRLLSVLSDGKVEVRNEDFPAFIAKLYEYFHYLKLCQVLGYDGLSFKSRGIGASEIAASNLACAYTFHKASYNIVTAFDEKYVTTTLQKVWQELDFLNTCTEDAFRRVRMKIDTNMKKKASKVDADKNEFGWGSVIEGITADDPRKLRGNRVNNIYFEEAGSNKALIDTYVQSRALVDILGHRVGSRFIYGTAGDVGLNLAGLKTMFFNPEEYSILPYVNKHTLQSEPQMTGYFIPSYTMWFGDLKKGIPGFDHRGVVNEKEARKFYEARWSKMNDPKLLLKDKAEYCFTPEDAFKLEGSNVFDAAKLAEQQMNIEQLKLVAKPKKASLIWPYNKELGGIDKDKTPTLKYEETGLLLVVEEPIRDASGIPPANLYVIGVDGIDAGKETSTGQNDVSKYAILVFRRLFGLQPPKIVAAYKHRPDNPEDAHNMALKLAQFYNAKVLFEATRVSIFTHFKKLNKVNYFLKRPKATISSSRQNTNLYGCPATDAIIEHQILLILLYVYDYYDQIDFLDIIDELLRYSYEAKRKFDYVAAFGMVLLADEELMGKIPRAADYKEKKLQSFGYYINDYGQKVFGIKNKESGADPMLYGWHRDENQRYY